MRFILSPQNCTLVVLHAAAFAFLGVHKEHWTCNSERKFEPKLIRHPNIKVLGELGFSRNVRILI